MARINRAKLAQMDRGTAISVNMFGTNSPLTSRKDLMERLGYEYGGNRDLYEALGYKKLLEYQDYLSRYKRQDIAKRLIDAPADAVWSSPPRVLDDIEKISPFEKAWKELVKTHNLWGIFARADKLCGIGEYAVLLLGFDDTSRLDKEVSTSRKNKLLYVHPYSQGSVSISEWDSNQTSPRFGKPTYYMINISKPGHVTEDSVMGLRVHYTRVVHVCDDLLDNSVYGTPRMESVFNRLQDLEKIVGGSGEMFWRGARPGYVAEADPEVTIEEDTIEELNNQMAEFENHLRRWLRVQGITVKELSPQVVSPLDHIEGQISMIAAAKGMPKRILMGSERGELSSSQDKEAWITFVSGRRTSFAEPFVLEPFISRMIDYKVLPSPKQGEYKYVWTDLRALGDKEKADIGRTKADALFRYISIPGSELIVPPEMFQSDFLGWDQDMIERARTIVGGDIMDELREIQMETKGGMPDSSAASGEDRDNAGLDNMENL